MASVGGTTGRKRRRVEPGISPPEQQKPRSRQEGGGKFTPQNVALTGVRAGQHVRNPRTGVIMRVLAGGALPLRRHVEGVGRSVLPPQTVESLLRQQPSPSVCDEEMLPADLRVEVLVSPPSLSTRPFSFFLLLN